MFFYITPCFKKMQEMKKKKGGKDERWYLVIEKQKGFGGKLCGQSSDWYTFSFWRTHTTAAPLGWVSCCHGNNETREVTWLSPGDRMQEIMSRLFFFFMACLALKITVLEFPLSNKGVRQICIETIVVITFVSTFQYFSQSLFLVVLVVLC